MTSLKASPSSLPLYPVTCSNSLPLFSPSQRPYNIAVVVLLTLSGVLIGLSYDDLPDTVAIYINHPMAEGGFGPKQVLWETLLFFSLVELLLFWLIRRTRGLFASKNRMTRPLPTGVKPEHILGVLGVSCAFACLAITGVVILSALGYLPNGRTVLYPALPLFLILAPVGALAYGILSRNA